MPAEASNSLRVLSQSPVINPWGSQDVMPEVSVIEGVAEVPLPEEVFVDVKPLWK